MAFPFQCGHRYAGYTMERMIEALRILRQEYHFNGYIHAKTIPRAADAELVRRIRSFGGPAFGQY